MSAPTVVEANAQIRPRPALSSCPRFGSTRVSSEKTGTASAIDVGQEKTEALPNSLRLPPPQRRVRFHLSRFRILPRLGSQHTIFRKLVRMIVFDPARHMTPPSLIPHRLVIGGRLGSLQRVHHNLPRGIRFQPKPTTSISQVMQPLCREGLHE